MIDKRYSDWTEEEHKRLRQYLNTRKVVNTAIFILPVALATVWWLLAPVGLWLIFKIAVALLIFVTFIWFFVIVVDNIDYQNRKKEQVERKSQLKK
jgi:hypothetical protein